MVINNRLRTTEIKKVFWYKAKTRSNFKVGNNEIYQFHKINFDVDYNKKSPILDLTALAYKNKK